MGLKLITPPTIEPVSLAEVKRHLRMDSAEEQTILQSIVPGSHAIAAGYSLEGAAVEVLGYTAVVILEAGTVGAGGTVDVKLQESDDNVTYDDVTDGDFTQVTAANDNATSRMEYTGNKKYIRALATVAGAACEFGVSVIKSAAANDEDALLTALITAAREYCEGYQNRLYITQTWELVLDSWPGGSYQEIPRPPLQSITSIKYKDSDGAETTWADTNYIADPDSYLGKVVLAYNCSWPTVTLYPVGAIRIRFVAGYGDEESDVPQRIKQAILLLVGHWYENREAASERAGQEIPFAVHALLNQDRVVPV